MGLDREVSGKGKVGLEKGKRRGEERGGRVGQGVVKGSIFENDRFYRRFNFWLGVLDFITASKLFLSPFWNFIKRLENEKNRLETFENDEIFKTKFW